METVMTKDTSKDYDAMIGYVAEDNLNKASLDTFIGISDEKEYRPEVKKKDVDSEFPEDWQNLWVNFKTMDEYVEFMNIIGSSPSPKLRQFIYEQPGADNGIFGFLE
jgi:hypothetical protein